MHDYEIATAIGQHNKEILERIKHKSLSRTEALRTVEIVFPLSKVKGFKKIISDYYKPKEV